MGPFIQTLRDEAFTLARLDVDHDGFPEVLGSGGEASSTLLRPR